MKKQHTGARSQANIFDTVFHRRRRTVTDLFLGSYGAPQFSSKDVVLFRPDRIVFALAVIIADIPDAFFTGKEESDMHHRLGNNIALLLKVYGNLPHLDSLLLCLNRNSLVRQFLNGAGSFDHTRLPKMVLHIFESSIRMLLQVLLNTALQFFHNFLFSSDDAGSAFPIRL